MHLSPALGLDKKTVRAAFKRALEWGGRFAHSDMDSLVVVGWNSGCRPESASAARGEVNSSLAERLLNKIAEMLHSVENKDFGIVGLSFKPSTNSVSRS